MNLRRYLDRMVIWVGIVLAALTVFSWISGFFTWGNRFLFHYVRSNILTFWLLALSVFILLLLLWVWGLYKRFIRGFSDNFDGSWQDNWEFEGAWKRTEQRTLLVKGSNTPELDGGGITKGGAFWENYSLTFSARIMNKCLGVIVRAKDLNNYYMFQIHADKIVPHRRVEVPVVELSRKIKLVSSSEEVPDKPMARPVKFVVGWQEFEPILLTRHLDDWFDVRLTVRGSSVLIYINGDMILERNSFLQLLTGKVGFRNHGTEAAEVRNVRVRLQA